MTPCYCVELHEQISGQSQLSIQVEVAGRLIVNIVRVTLITLLCWPVTSVPHTTVETPWQGPLTDTKRTRQTRHGYSLRMDTETKGTSSDIVCTTIQYLYPHPHMKVLKIVLFDEHFITKLLHEIVIDVSRYTPAMLLNTYHTVYCKPLIRKLLY